MRKYDIVEFDPVFYRNNNHDLMNLSDIDLRMHYHLHGYDEGRRASPLSTRDGLIEAIGSTKITLEIGPFFKPALRGDNVRYFDVYTTDELRSRARAIGGIESAVPNIDFVSREGLISNVAATFDYIFSSHSIEHQPDLIGHLRDASKILSDDGVYWFIVPDCRYSFDALLPPSKISDIITAYFGARKVHTIGSVIEHRAMTTHNDPARHWEEDRDPEMQYELDPARVKAAIEEFSAAKGDYIDVHAWQFTPLSFASILKCLIALKMIPFSEACVMGTPRGSNEFTAMLKRR